ncbi:metabolite traffic protein EboE [Fuerstiella marisgermanici]|uniref:Xylose isomerase-like TIM barrel n=1 Tax=Fuerstiella marisgermanici TaxID=1891926 RepID=A0A1P8WEK1_9PLAN|nr:metabolite traffic protein EboE [Fuerstiella marisgermanici]APZ92479.1 Xylose isomerase-like TIM barrel [Fuerstiella marisgermanici]
MAFSTLPLSYCTNVHPGRTVDEVVDGLVEHTATVRQQLNSPMAAGLWLSRGVASELLKTESELERLGQTLWQHDLVCYTLNAFPYGDFHSERVKEQVYLPDWASTDRMKYTCDCAKILAKLIPETAEGSISTVPLGGNMNSGGRDFYATCCHNLIETAKFLKDLHDKTGRMIRLAIEPEPMCQLSFTAETTVPIFHMLFEMAEALGCLETVQTFIGLCFDVCHQAVVFEDVAESIELVVSNGIRINKVHITNAVELEEPHNNPAGLAALCDFVEPRYLHQTYGKMPDGRVLYRPDLLTEDINRLPPDKFLQADTWRVHFHVPVFADTLGPLNTTRRDLKAALRKIQTLDYAPHLEVETYTWPVMPDSGVEQQSLADQITQELESAYRLLSDLS